MSVAKVKDKIEDLKSENTEHLKGGHDKSEHPVHPTPRKCAFLQMMRQMREFHSLKTLSNPAGV